MFYRTFRNFSLGYYSNFFRLGQKKKKKSTTEHQTFWEENWLSFTGLAPLQKKKKKNRSAGVVPRGKNGKLTLEALTLVRMSGGTSTIASTIAMSVGKNLPQEIRLSPKKHIPQNAALFLHTPLP